MVGDGRSHGLDLVRREVGRGQKGASVGRAGLRVALAVAELAYVMQPGGGLDDLGVGPGQLCQPQGQRDDGGHVLPTVVKGDFLRAQPAAQLG